ncbi:MAG: GDSL-type esterase/lipase family protein [Flavobacteriaceae bacterium]
MKPISPIYIATFILCVLALLGAGLFITTEQDEKEGVFIDQLHIKYPTYATFFEHEKAPQIDSVQQTIEQITTQIQPIEVEKINLGIDSLITHKPNAENKVSGTIIDFSKIDTTAIQRITYPKDSVKFITSLKKSLSSQYCRIVHYGDSQLEGDRITGYLRNRLQRMYGGSGPGFIPIKQVYHQISAIVTPSDTWQRHAIFDRTQKRFQHKKYGLYLSSSRFTPILKDSISLDTLRETTAKILIKPSKITYKKFRAFSSIGLHYTNCTNPVQVSVYTKGQLIQQDSLITDGNYHNFSIDLPGTPSDLNIELTGKISPDFYGITLDGKTGVQIDNVAMRGASGTLFTKTNAADFKHMVKELNPKIMMLQFGGNTVPYIKDSIAVNNYTNTIKRQINWLRHHKPSIDFIFIGPTDLATSINGNMTTYELLPYLNQKLKEVCYNNNVAYWDMFQAMGGKNSISHWVNEGLVGGDYVHFTPKGTKYISELFFTALYLDLKPNSIQ